MVNPCMDCADRTLGCHDRCLAHAEWKAQRTAANRHAADTEGDKFRLSQTLERRKDYVRRGGTLRP